MRHLGRVEIYMLMALWCMVCFSGWSMCSAYAKYVSGASGSNNARVAKFGVMQEGAAVQQITVEYAYPGFCEEYPVIVTNHSEVDIVYNISVVNKTNQLPLQFRMLSENGKEIASNGAKISAGDSSEHIYKLEVSWSADQADPAYAGKTDVIDIYLEAMQKN